MPNPGNWNTDWLSSLSREEYEEWMWKNMGRYVQGGPHDPNIEKTGLGASGDDDWWSMNPYEKIKPRSMYEELLGINRDRFVQDPFQQATAAGANSPMASALWETVYGKGVPRMENVIGELDSITKGGTQASPERFDYLKMLAGMIQGNQQNYASALGQGYTSGLGTSSSMIQNAGGQLQGYRGQDQQRYLEEKRMKHEMDMLIAQLQAQAAAQDGGDVLFDILGSILGIGGAGGFDWLLKLLGSGGSGGGYQ